MLVLIPIPHRDFDPTEVAVSWRVLRDAGHSVVFATPDGKPGAADPLMVTGEGLDVWGLVPGLKRFPAIGRLLRAHAPAREAYRDLEQDADFRRPFAYTDVKVEAFDALLLPGGHAKGMRPYLEDQTLQAFVGAFFDMGKPVAAVCHGVVLAARSVSPKTGKSVLHGRKTTALTWKMERSAWWLTRLGARFWDPWYYRTYREEAGEAAGYRSVQQEVTRALARPGDFLDVSPGIPDHFRKSTGMFRDTVGDARPAWVVRDGTYLSARWPGDVHTFAHTFDTLIREHYAAPTA